MSLQPTCSIPDDIGQLSTDSLSRPLLKTYPKSVFGKQKRSFSSVLYEKHDFIEYSVKKDAVYCFPCRLFGAKTGHSQENTFTTRGFQNWKKTEKIVDHSYCKYHKDSVVAWLSFKSAAAAGNVVQQQMSYHARLVRENREYVKSLARIAIFCGRQNIALRGHDESETSCNKGNFLELVDLVASESKEFETRRAQVAENATYVSSDSQNALIEAAARCVLSKIQKAIIESGMYAVISDCCTDMVTDNLSVCVRYIDMDAGVVNERFLQFTELSSNELDAASVTEKIISVLQQGSRFQVPLQKCVAQSSDGASVMSGKENGVQKLLRDAVGNPCLFVHCYAHRLNLVLSVASTEVQCSKVFFDLLKKLIAFINGSCIRKNIFAKLQLNDPQKPSVLVLPDLCYHKWNFRERAISVVHKRYSHVLETLDYIAQNGKPDERSEAEGLLGQLKMSVNVCLLVLLSDLFTQLGSLSDVLQSEKCDLASALHLASAQTECLKMKRSDSHFAKVWSIVTVLAAENDIELSLPVKRVSKVPRKLRQYLTDTSTGHRQLEADESLTPSPETYYRRQVFFPVMDRLVTEMERRFGDNDGNSILRGIAACHPDSAEYLDMDVLHPLIDAYKLNTTGSLSSQIDVCKLLITKAAVKPTEILDVISLLKPTAGFPDLRRLLQLALTVPVANVASERSFSSMRKIRTYVRSSMKEDRLSGIANLTVENEVAKRIDIDEVVNIFAKMPSLRDNHNTDDLEDKNARRLQLLM